MLREYAKALTKRVDTRALMQFKPPTLPSRIYTKTLCIDNAHYGKYCEEVKWGRVDTLHPLYLQMLSLPLQMQCLLDKKSPFPLLGLIHAANNITIHDDIDISEPLECRVKFSDVRPHSKGWDVDIELIALQGGSCVYTAVSTYLVKVKAVHVAPRAPVVGNELVCDGSDSTLINTLSINSDTGRKYAKISGDYNPIHLYGLTAKLFGFKKPIAHGMWTLANAVSSLANATDKSFYRVDCRFKRPVFLPANVDVITECFTDENVKLSIVGHKNQEPHVECSISF